eukprot:TRINITY_DN44113_c0_g1_i1.p1 TRINITY_DN44113_c0_g1~~TRINITY_DN44113_c0_g1_i1.p1  ORF type:complete len:500 (+),score=75.17 TRINITY_DN44113_c0_g1_i1:163-1500(+)
MEVDLGLEPSRLAVLAAAQGVAMSVATPIWGHLVDGGFSRQKILASGAIAWGLLTLVMAFVINFYGILFLRILNGAALGCIFPVVQSLVPEFTEQAELAFSFSLVEGSVKFGQAVTTAFIVMISEKVLLGVAGWRVGFILISVASFLAAWFVMIFLSGLRSCGDGNRIGVLNELSLVAKFFRIPTFVILVLQGCFGCVPWSALGFTTMYFQYRGLSNAKAGLCASLIVVGGCVGSVLGGLISDTLTRCSRFGGRPLTAQISVLLGIPIVFTIFTRGGSGEEDSSGLREGILCFSLGIVALWCAGGCNRPIFCDIVTEDARASGYAWLYCLESTFGTFFGSLIVGVLSESLFDYVPNSTPIKDMSPEVRRANADALAKSILVGTVGPWVLCFVLYSSLHLTYAKDAAALQESENMAKDGSTDSHHLQPLGDARAKDGYLSTASLSS